jgi:phosphoenolpyruvate carboxykinase (ATP)
MSASLNNSKDPVERTSSPYTDPRELGPKSKILASRKSNYHSTSLRNMVSNTVNKTALHPGGVQYVSPLNLSKTPLLAISGI